MLARALVVGVCAVLALVPSASASVKLRAGPVELRGVAFRTAAGEFHATRVISRAGSVPEVGALIAEVRDRTSARILEGLGAGAAPKPRVAVRAWLWFLDGAIVDWLEHRDLSRAELGGFLLGSLAGALSAAGAGELLAG